MIENVTEDDKNNIIVDSSNDRTMEIRLFKEFRYTRVSERERFSLSLSHFPELTLIHANEIGWYRMMRDIKTERERE